MDSRTVEKVTNSRFVVREQVQRQEKYLLQTILHVRDEKSASSHENPGVKEAPGMRSAIMTLQELHVARNFMITSTKN
jgi:hypothetical protein